MTWYLIIISQLLSNGQQCRPPLGVMNLIKDSCTPPKERRASNSERSKPHGPVAKNSIML